MTKKEKKATSNVIAGIYLFVGLYFYWVVFKSNNFYLLIGLLVSTVIIEGMIFLVLSKANSNKKKLVKKEERKNKEIKLQSNQLRSDKEIILTPLHELSWREFERLCYLYFNAKGYRPRETGDGADGGVDLIIYNRQHRTEEAVQIKHYIHSQKKITVEQIRELHSAKRNHKCLLSRFITTSSFTKDALKQADSFKMVCHDVHWVESKIRKWQDEVKKEIG